MTDTIGPLLGPGDRAPDFELPAADRDGRISLSDSYRRGPVLLLLLRGLYCAFCRRHISQLRSSCDLLQGAGIRMLGRGHRERRAPAPPVPRQKSAAGKLLISQP
jgi:peroxiredoxin